MHENNVINDKQFLQELTEITLAYTCNPLNARQAPRTIQGVTENFCGHAL